MYRQKACHRGIFSLLMLGLSLSAEAAPNLWWDHLERSPQEEVSACVHQASTAILKDSNQHVTSGPESVRSWSEQTVTVVECIRYGNQLVAAIIVTSLNSNDGARTFKTIRDGMQESPK